MQKTVTILLSDKRSGSTMLERELCKHPEVNHVSYTPHTYNETHYWLKAACMLPLSHEGFYGGLRPDSYGSRSLARKSLLNFLKRNSPDFTEPATDEELVIDGWTALCRQFAHPVFFEKSPQHPHHWAALELLLTWIKASEFEVRVIGLVRNPMSVMYSALKLFHTDPGERQFGWAQAYRNILKLEGRLSAGQFCMVRYEDIVRQPAIEFKRLCDFIGIDDDGNLGLSTHRDSVNKWREDAGFTLQLDPQVGEVAQRFGYSEEDVYNPPKPEPTIFTRVYRESVLGARRYRSKVYGFIERLKIKTGI